ncbi:MAG: hypothetical protein EB117_09100 [Betaproteobacteria bacterium]|nr:hypothetical protein [Betaproteobacteria bacterium]
MSAGAWVALVTAGAFVILCSGANGYAEGMRVERLKAKPVVLWKPAPPPPQCDQTDWLCLVAWAEEIKKGN